MNAKPMSHSISSSLACNAGIFLCVYKLSVLVNDGVHVDLLHVLTCQNMPPLQANPSLKPFASSSLPNLKRNRDCWSSLHEPEWT